MNILYVIHQFYPEFRSGTEKVLLTLSSALQRDGYAAHAVTYSLTDDDIAFEKHGSLLVRKYVYNNLPVVAVKHQIAPMDVSTHWDNPDIYNFALRFLQEQKRWDLVHIAHGMRMASFARAALDMQIPYVFTLTDFWMICPKIVLQTSSGALCGGPEGGKACRKLCPELPASLLEPRLAFARQILAGAKAVVAPSRFVAEVFKKEMPELNVHVIPHGMDLKHLKPNTKRQQLGEKIVLGYCGGMSPHKGVHLLLHAFRKLDRKNAELRLYGGASGDEDYFRSLREIAGQDARIKFCGTYREEEVGEVLQDIDVMVIPSLCYESYSLTLHEAFACGVPAIASRAGSFQEKIKDSVNGFTFRMGNVEDLRNKLQLILDQPEILNALKENLRQYVPPLVEEEAYLYQRLYRAAIP